MDRAEIIAALEALAQALHARGIEGELYVVGGAAIALAFDARRSTRDIDAIFEPKLEVYRAAEDVRADLGLPPGWLNDAVKGFLAGDDPDALPALERPGLRVLVASPRILLAMKVLAHRIGEDEDDVRLLAGELGLRTVRASRAPWTSAWRQSADRGAGSRARRSRARSRRSRSPAR